MRYRIVFAAFLLLPCALSSALSSAVELNSADMLAPAHERAKVGIERKYQSDQSRCAQMHGNQKEVCEKKAESTARINEQSLTARDNRSIHEHIDAGEAKTEAQYDLAKVRCADMAGESKATCLQKAQAEYEKTKSEVDLSKNTLEQSIDVDKAKTEAEYTIALKKCDGLTAVKKDRCQDMAKEKYRQN